MAMKIIVVVMMTMPLMAIIMIRKRAVGIVLITVFGSISNALISETNKDKHQNSETIVITMN